MFVVGSFGIAMAMLAVAIAMEMQVATARTGVATSRTGLEFPKINRALKGNRLPLVPDASLPQVPARAHEPKLPEGCVESAKSVRNAFWIEVPGRCVAAIPELARAIG
jgi:hypothetical protein